MAALRQNHTNAYSVNRRVYAQTGNAPNAVCCGHHVNDHGNSFAVQQFGHDLQLWHNIFPAEALGEMSYTAPRL